MEALEDPEEEQGKSWARWQAACLVVARTARARGSNNSISTLDYKEETTLEGRVRRPGSWAPWVGCLVVQEGISLRYVCLGSNVLREGLLTGLFISGRKFWVFAT